MWKNQTKKKKEKKSNDEESGPSRKFPFFLSFLFKILYTHTNIAVLPYRAPNPLRVRLRNFSMLKMRRPVASITRGCKTDQSADAVNA